MRKLVVCAAGLGVAALAFQSGLSSIGVDRAKFEEAVRAATRGQSLTYPAAFTGRAAADKFKALAPEARAALLLEALKAAKALISTPAFAKAHDAWLAEDRNAVNHGGVGKSDVQKKMETNPEAGMKDAMAIAAVQMGEALRNINDKNALKMMLDQDLQQASDAKLKQIAPLLNSNLKEFQKQYSLWKSAQMGGPNTEAAYQAALKAAGTMNSQEEMAEQQRKWDEQNLKAVLRKRLDSFIATAPTVDFAAATKQDGKVTRFVNPQYEQKNPEWKLMYRAGRAPVMAALEFARAWRKEF
jgi:hypothetical protein